VLDEQQPPTRLEHAVQLAQRGLRVRHGAEHERRHHGVERPVLERQRLGAGEHDRRRAERGDARSEALGHRLVWLREDQIQPGVVVGEVEAGAGADLEDAAAGLRHERAAARGEAGALGEPEERVIERGGQA
jgi:hypothetical protein